MKVLVITDSTSRSGGGLFDAERCLHHGLGQLGVDTRVLALRDEYSEADLSRWAPLKPEVFTHVGPSAVGWSPSLGKALESSRADMVYRAGLWRFPSRQAHHWSKKHQKPEIIAPHGMLDPWAVRNSRLKKKLASLWFEGCHLRDASCIRALCKSEAEAVRSYGLQNSICIVPNGIDLPAEVSEIEDQMTGSRGRESGKKILLFLGRIHPKKGLVNALRAWAKSGQQEEWQFVIAGWDQGGHEAELKELATELGIRWADVRDQEPEEMSPVFSFQFSEFQLLFVGPAFDDAKDALLRRASAFILPSFSEGLPMSVLEAWSYGLPVLMTGHCNLLEGFEADAAIRIETDVESIAEGMRLVLRSPALDLRSLGQNGRSLVERQFTWPQVALQMKEVYEWILGGGEKPECVWF